MPVTVLNAFDEGLNENDVVFRQRKEAREKEDEKTEFLSQVVEITHGPKNVREPIKLRWPKEGRFVFATFQDNPAWQTQARDAWQAAAIDALEKFCAIRNAAIIFGPRQEDSNRYNMMVEVRESLK